MAGQFDPEKHPRDASGKFSSTGSAAGAADRIAAQSTKAEREAIVRLRRAKVGEMLQKAFATEGFTYDALHDVYPTKGFVVSVHTDKEEQHEKGQLGEKEIEAYIVKHADTLADPKKCLGAFYDPDVQKWFLDVVQVEEDRETAVALGRQHNQRAIYDLEAKTPVWLDKEARRESGPSGST